MENLLKTINFADDKLRRTPFDYRLLEHFKNQMRPTVFIGLGGGGTNAVSAIKHLLDRTFGGKDEAGARRIPDAFRFLAFDSDPTAPPPNLVRGEEWLHLTAEGLGGGVWTQKRQEAQFRSWVPQNLEAPDLAAGCKGYRTLGRFVFQQNIGTFSEKFNAAYNDVTHSSAAGKMKPAVYLFCTLAGGTGSGCLLDACFHLRSLSANPLIVGFLALAEGFGSGAGRIKRSKVGVYAALREIDHFMSAERLNPWLNEHHQGNANFTYPGGVSGRYEKPFDQVLIFGPVQQNERHTLPSSGAMSGFMARCAFALSAYPSDQSDELAAGQTFVANLNNIDQDLIDKSGGANVSYMVPAYSSLHAPVEEGFDLLALESARVILDYLKDGEANTKHMQEAEVFLADVHFKASELLAKATNQLNYEGSLPRVSAGTRLEELSEILKHRRERYDTVKNGELFTNFSQMLESRFRDDVLARILKYEPAEETEREALTSGATAETNPALASLAKTIREFENTFDQRLGELMCDPKYRRLGVQDFIGDTLVLLTQQRLYLANNVSGAAGTLDALLRDHWKEGSEFRETLTDVTTNDGPLDVDFHQVSELVEDYREHFNNGWDQLVDWVRNSAALSAVERALEHAKKRKQEVDQVVNNYDTAGATLSEKIDQLLVDLKRQADGMDEELDTLCSYSLLDRAWRDRFKKAHHLDDAESLVRRATDSARQADGISWNPLDVIRVYADPQENPTRISLAAFICQDMANAVMRILEPEFKAMTIWQGGAGLEKVFAYMGEGPGLGEENIRAVMSRLENNCQPQFDLAMMVTRLNRERNSIALFAGPQGITKDVLRGSINSKSINRALSYESHRLALIGLYYPVGLAGCPRVKSVFKQAYDAHFGSFEDPKVCDNERRNYHAFPESWTWREPWEVDEAPDPAKQKFAQAWLAGLALGDGSKLSADGVAALIQQAVKKMDTLSQAPRTKAVGVFIAGGTDVWLAPFFAPDIEQGLIGDVQPPQRLGKNIAEAIAQITRDANAREDVVRWAEWFEANKTTIFTDAELKVLKSKTVDTLKQRLVQSGTDADQRKAWTTVLDQAKGSYLFAE